MTTTTNPTGADTEAAPTATPDRSETARHVDQLHATLAALVGVDVTTAARASTLAAVAEYRRQHPAWTYLTHPLVGLPRLMSAVGTVAARVEQRDDVQVALVAVAAEALTWLDDMTEPEPDF